MIAGMAVGFNLVFEHDNLITAICFASVVVNLLPYTLSRLDKVAGICNACIAGFTLLCFVLGLLISHPHTPVNMNAMFPKLSGESAYSLMALLGANIIVHNFYTHSAFVQVQRRSSHTLGSLFHDHLFSILFIFTGIYLVNYILLSSAADESSETVVMNFQDATELMHQIFTNPAGPIVLLVILLFSSHIISLTCIVSGEVISENFFGVKLPLSAHHLLPKGLAMVLNIYFAKVAGPEGIYQLLIMCPVIQAMLLPSSIIPILRVSSSRLLMGRYRIALCIEIFAFLAFLLVVFTNIIFTAEIMFGTSTWTNNLKGDTGSPAILPYSVVVLISCASIGFTLLLAVTPLKSASNEAQTHLSSMHSQRGALGTTQREATSLKKFEHEEVQSCSVGAVLMGSSEGHKKSVHLRRTLSG
ncbi:Ethylene-insensitive protein 2 [Zea mays]|nr:Ethylene-insensitive protein 2 [Zea mays]AQK63672.1 Ethylene-insensitive protein 2 [Zea mays]